MNKLINNLAQIADCAEYFDKKTGAAWKIRSALTNMAVWACNSYLYAIKADNGERIARSMVEVSTLRSWVHDSNCNAFTLDLTPSAVARTLGLERVVDVHEEACRSARQKCIQTRSALHFKKYYDAAIAAFEEQRRARQENVDRIAGLLADTGFLAPACAINVMLDTMQLQLTNITPGKDTDKRYVDDVQYERTMGFEGQWVSDLDLYDDQAVERQVDQLAETVGNALEAMYDVCEAELAAAITADKVQRLTSYHRAINNMLVITGVDMKKLGERRAKLEAAIEAQIATASQSVQDIDASIAEQITAMAEPEVVEPVKPAKKMQRIKKTSLKELGELVK